MKKVLLSVATVFLAALMPLSGFAASVESKIIPEGISKKEARILVDEVGLDEDELKNFPSDVLKSLIENGAVKIASNEEVHTFEKEISEEVNEENSDKSGISPQALEKGTDIKLAATAFKVTSDMPGYKKFYLYGNFEWLKRPVFTFTDGVSLGYPDNTKWFLPTNSKGDVTQHETQYCYRVDNNVTAPWNCSKKTKPSYSSLGSGVGTNFTLQSLPSNLLHQGYIGQYVYVKDTESGTTNVRFEYGHTTVTAEVSFSVLPTFGVGVTPKRTTEAADFLLTFSY
ncbi:hypothetical protein [Brevibacillus borstelensis]|uniref:hypothetical protein n=1 Tax=Brevibacillus borstelensis TaxID=45462 RepID=UPI0030C552E0